MTAMARLVVWSSLLAVGLGLGGCAAEPDDTEEADESSAAASTGSAACSSARMTPADAAEWNRLRGNRRLTLGSLARFDGRTRTCSEDGCGPWVSRRNVGLGDSFDSYQVDVSAEGNVSVILIDSNQAMSCSSRASCGRVGGARRCEPLPRSEITYAGGFRSCTDSDAPPVRATVDVRKTCYKLRIEDRVPSDEGQGKWVERQLDGWQGINSWASPP